MELFLNRGYANILSNIDGSQTSVTLQTGHGARFGTIDAGNHIRVVFLDSAMAVSEICFVTAVSGDVLTITRGQDGTVGVAHLAGDRIENRAGKSTFSSFDQFPSGTRMTFNQTAAPTGWTKDTTAALNDSALRVVTGTVGSGGTYAFSAGCTVVAAHTHTFTSGSESAGHTHSGATGTVSSGHTHNTALVSSAATGYGLGSSVAGVSGASFATSNSTLTSDINANHTHSFTSGGASVTHTHSGTTADSNNSETWVPKYIDIIIASKN